MAEPQPKVIQKLQHKRIVRSSSAATKRRCGEQRKNTKKTDLHIGRKVYKDKRSRNGR
jgi:hypothetical protein